MWSGVKAWQSYNPSYEYSGFPYKYVTEISCGEKDCEKEWDYTNLTFDLLILAGASLLITLFTYWVRKKMI